MDIVLLLFAAAIVVLIVGFLTLFRNKIHPVQASTQEAAAESTDTRANPTVRRRQLALARNSRARVRDESDNEDNNEDKTSKPKTNVAETKIGTKKLAKLQAKAEKKAQRENEEKIRQEKKKAQEIAEEERKKEELAAQEEERKRAEQERKLKEEKEKQEYEEYLKLKEAFSVQEEGFEEAEEDGTLQDFINHIKANKIVVLEDIAAQFKLKTQDVINRINSLQNEGQLTGVIDDRGKFIFISQDELDAVAKFVKQRGRVSIAELVENSNRLINLTPVESC